MSEFQPAFEWIKTEGGWSYPARSCPRLENAVYRFVSGSQVTYVGSARWLWRRMRGHRSNARLIQSGSPKSPHHVHRYGEIIGAANARNHLVVQVLLLPSHQHALAAESFWIRKLRPAGNSSGLREPPESS